MLFKHVQQALFRERLGQYIIHAMLEIHGNIVTSDVRCHGNDWRRVELSNKVASRNAVEVRHDYVHKHKIVLAAGVHLVDSFQSIKLDLVSCMFSFESIPNLQHCQWHSGKHTGTCFQCDGRWGHPQLAEFVAGGSNLGLRTGPSS